MSVQPLCKVIPFTSVNVLERPSHMDIVTFDTEIRGTIWAGYGKEPYTAVMRTEMARGTGAKWVRDTFGVEPHVIQGY